MAGAGPEAVDPDPKRPATLGRAQIRDFSALVLFSLTLSRSGLGGKAGFGLCSASSHSCEVDHPDSWARQEVGHSPAIALVSNDHGIEMA